ncbi:MAG: polysaccharide biosynthesis tyrosine autokinase [Deltaproteobacteria bacterium]|nr:polysaccharide biosynthesis tyrosine autokinase [Candidatus Zymogenaceae bacterium]
MPQYEIQLKDLIRILRRRRNIIFFSMIVLGVLSIVFAKLQSPSLLYQAIAKVNYDQTRSLAGITSPVYYFSPYDNINSQTKIITSFPVLEKAAKKLGYLNKKLSSSEILKSKEHMAVILGLEGQIRCEIEENTNIINIKVTSIDPAMASDIANAVAEGYRDYNREQINKRTIDTKDFIEKQLNLVGGRLNDAEENLKNFQQNRNIVALDAQASNDLNSLADLETEYEKLNRENNDLSAFKRRLSSKTISGGEIFPILEEDIYSNLFKLNTELQKLLLERDELMTVYTVNHPKIIDLNDKINNVLNLITVDITSRISSNGVRMANLNKDITIYKERGAEYPADNLSLAKYEREVKLQSDLYAELSSKYQEILIQESGMVVEVGIVAPALVPGAPINPPKIFSSLFIGMLLGLFLGIFFAIVMENLDTSIGTIEDVESYLEIPVLGVIPSITVMTEQKGEEPDVEHHRASLLTISMDPKSPVIEAYRSLRTNLIFLHQEKGIKTFMVTSSSLQEGKTINCINIAVTLALGGYRTLLVEADLRRATIAKTFGIERSPGLSEVILGIVPWREVTRDINDILLGGLEMDTLIKSPELANLSIITSGAFPTNPSELLSSQQMAKFIEEVKAEYDLVIFDTTPVLPVTDAVLLSQKIEGVIILYEVGKIARGVLKRTKSHLDSVKANILGIILNNVRPEYGPEYYDYHYQYYYEEGKPPRRVSDWERFKESFSPQHISRTIADILATLARPFRKKEEKK